MPEKEKLTIGEIIVYVFEGFIMMLNLFTSLIHLFGSLKASIYFLLAAICISPILANKLRKINFFRKSIIITLGIQFTVASLLFFFGVFSSVSSKETSEPVRTAVIMETDGTESSDFEVTTSDVTETESRIEETVTESETESLTEEIITESETEAVTEMETEEVNIIQASQLYLDFFEPYADSVGTLLVEGFQQSGEAKLTNYDVTITEGNENDMWKYEIHDKKSEDYITVWFFPEDTIINPSDWVWTLSLLTYEASDKEISVTDELHTIKPEYHIWDKSQNLSDDNIKNIDELKTFLFAEIEISDTSELETKEPTTEAIVTEQVTQPRTEPPTEAPTIPVTQPPVTQPPAPVVISHEYWINTDSGKFHLSTCHTIKNPEDAHWQTYSGDRNDLINQGYEPCGVCDP
ncbi:MAG: hypothetical protein IJ642_09485 [Oscillospiraceae bacterium]|nr:hypothetical protein [Oscillospiraceae bacterium]